jgi:hypothetical protein
MFWFWSKRTPEEFSLELQSIYTNGNQPEEHMPLLESNLLVFESTSNNKQLPCANRIELWLEDNHGCENRIQGQEKSMLKAWVGFLSRRSNNTSISDTQQESQITDWFWDRESNYSGFSDFA